MNVSKLLTNDISNETSNEQEIISHYPKEYFEEENGNVVRDSVHTAKKNLLDRCQERRFDSRREWYL